MKMYKSFGALGRKLQSVAENLQGTYAEGMRATALSVQDDAKSRIGHYQAGWEMLAPSTIADKRSQGFLGPLPGGDGDQNPLLRTGEMRDSIGCWSTPSEFIVGSTSDILKYQEFGTKTIPPRPVLGPALFHTMPFAVKVIGKAVRNTIADEK